MFCEIIFVLNDKTELSKTEEIEKYRHLFPQDILATIRPIYINCRLETKDWHKSIIRIYQNGTHEIQWNVCGETFYFRSKFYI